MKKDNITLIGMPGSGKSFIGKLLAKKLNFRFIDSDDYIERKEKMTLQEIINRKGDEEFLKTEEKRNLELLPLKNYVLTPGGSIVYSKKIMKSLRNCSFIAFLDVPLKTVERRRPKQRGGIVGLKTKSIKMLFEERAPLYNKYANLKVNCFRKSNKKIIDEIIEKYGSYRISQKID